MSARSLFNIVLKVLGIYFFKDIILSVPTLFSVIYSFGDGDLSGAFSTLLVLLLTMLIYGVTAYCLVFRSDWVMARLRLLEKVPEDPVPLNVHSSTVVSISILIVALYLIVQAVPLFIRALTKWYQYSRITKGMFNTIEPFDYSMLLVYAAEVIIGLLLIGQLRQVVSYIELKTRKSN